MIRMFEGLKEKLHLKHDYDELKDHIMSPKFEPISSDVRERFEPSGGFAPRREVERREEIGPISFERPEELEPEPISFRPQQNDLGRIEDEIRFMKEQLSAIKAIVETINERVKNIQREVERKY